MNYKETKAMWAAQTAEMKRKRHKDGRALKDIADEYGVSIQWVLRKVGPRKVKPKKVKHGKGQKVPGDTV